MVLFNRLLNTWTRLPKNSAVSDFGICSTKGDNRLDKNSTVGFFGGGGGGELCVFSNTFITSVEFTYSYKFWCC